MIKRGDKHSEEVYQLQRMLRAVGWDIWCTSSYNVETEAAVRCFQQENELMVDGIPGPLTKSALQVVPSSPLRNPILWWHDVPYLTQRDNLNDPGSTCNVTCIAMCLQYLGMESPEGEQLEDQLSKVLEANDAVFARRFPVMFEKGYSAYNVHGMLKWLVNKKGFQDLYKLNSSLAEIRDLGLHKGPTIVSGKFTSAGHLLVVTGETCLGDLIVNDPWGNWESGYKDHNGEQRIYSRNKFALAAQRSAGIWIHHLSS